MTLHTRKSTQTGSGVPTSLTPEFIGQNYLDTANNLLYIATGLTTGAWTPAPEIDEGYSTSDPTQFSTVIVTGPAYADHPTNLQFTPQAVGTFEITVECMIATDDSGKPALARGDFDGTTFSEWAVTLTEKIGDAVPGWYIFRGRTIQTGITAALHTVKLQIGHAGNGKTVYTKYMSIVARRVRP